MAKRNVAEIERELRDLLPKVRGHVGQAIQFVIAHGDEVPVRSMRELAKRAGVPPVTLVRIAQKVGFEGFDEFRDSYVEAYMAGTHRNRSQAAELISLASAEGALGFAAKFAERELEIQRHTVAGLDSARLEAATADIVAADRVFVSGRRTMFGPAHSIAYSLRKAKPATHLLDVGGGMGLELTDLSPRDLFIGLSFHPYSRIVRSFAQSARSQGAKVIAITDSETSPIGALADHTFLSLVRGYSFPDSVAGAQMLGSILVGLAVATMGQAGLDRITANDIEMKNSGELLG
ncbi:MurR/RpiR family transcriptional regulator [Azospirillum sp. RWY-5-1]|uniref:MurR/RpiR family transcriptional regulator n=1 Tax=Azospirillum oleiclasticum TaxID=2735135 RepID=A0ABX2TG17_9PROT|nr:MurR/RpiR family transcriptional regulator [Azospirillum oleiclasticum]NYZ14368.1 MurR/RpiR family transcriptional regulator [Azospirillum oleiclasticum]NYZ23280.1 MurR/RpiR family transcriptional regulator [Azospirillum oleiclasticum]